MINCYIIIIIIIIINNNNNCRGCLYPAPHAGEITTVMRMRGLHFTQTLDTHLTNRSFSPSRQKSQTPTIDRRLAAMDHGTASHKTVSPEKAAKLCSCLQIRCDVAMDQNPGTHQNSCDMDVHPPKLGCRFWLIPTFRYI